MDPDDLSHLLNTFVYGIERRMRSVLDGLNDDLCSDDEAIRRPAEEKALEYCEWLFGPLTPASKEERQTTIEKALLAVGVLAAQARSAAKHAIRLPPGAPRTTGRQAIRALTLHLTTDKSYREIALMIKGPCEHVCPTCGDAKRPEMVQSGIRMRKQRQRCSSCECTIRPEGKKQQVCSKCVDALRASIGRLEVFLSREGLYPDLPRRMEIERMSPDELERVVAKSRLN